MYFWRTKQQQEIDLVEEKDGKIKAFEVKWKKKKVNFSKSFVDAYQAETLLVDKSNFRDFVTI